MTRYSVTIDGRYEGVYEGRGPNEALDNMAFDRGYKDHPDMIEKTGQVAKEISIILIEQG